MKNIIVSTVLVSLLLVPLGSVQSFAAGSAESYLASHSGNPWATMALSVLGTNNIPANHLKSVSGNSAIDYAAPILAITSIGENPHTFGSQDYVTALKGFKADGQIGDPALVNDDIFGILALISSGVNKTDSAVTDAKTFILAQQNSDHGWGFASAADSDTNTTAAAVLALLASGENKNSVAIQNAASYLAAAQNSDGGITYDPQSAFGTDSDSSSTAWVIWALNALDIDPASWSQSGGNLVSYLESTQAAGGYFTYQPGSPEDAFSAVTTAYAVIALTGKTLPLVVMPSAQEFEFRIEGSQETVCAGEASGPTALDVVKNAALECGFTYNIQDTSFGPYLDRINDDEAAGLQGWLYFVNWLSPSVGAQDYVLETGDEVLWYFGDFDWIPTRLELGDTQIEPGELATVTVEQFLNGSFSPLAGANVHYGATTVQTSNAGIAVLSPGAGFYQIFAEKPGYIRSNKILLGVGEPLNEAVNLSVNVEDGQVGGETIAFSVNPDALDFGDLKRGESASQSLTIQNQGTVDIAVESMVDGDQLFEQNLTVGGVSWQNFQSEFAPQQTKETQASLTVPNGYNGGTGSKNGVLTFWATAQ